MWRREGPSGDRPLMCSYGRWPWCSTVLDVKMRWREKRGHEEKGK